MNNKNLVQIISVIPINFNYKSDFEKKSILDSYKILFQTINFDIQIFIMTEKEDFLFLNNEINFQQNEKMKNEYINFINNLYNERQLSKKVFYIVIKEDYSEKNIPKSMENLNEKFNSLNNLLSKCGNQLIKIENHVEIEKILTKIFLCEKIS